METPIEIISKDWKTGLKATLNTGQA